MVGEDWQSDGQQAGGDQHAESRSHHFLLAILQAGNSVTRIHRVQGSAWNQQCLKPYCPQSYAGLTVSAHTLLSPPEPGMLEYDRERLEDVGYMTCMTLVLL